MLTILSQPSRLVAALRVSAALLLLAALVLEQEGGR